MAVRQVRMPRGRITSPGVTREQRWWAAGGDESAGPDPGQARLIERPAAGYRACMRRDLTMDDLGDLAELRLLAVLAT